MIKKQRNARALLAEVKDLDLENKVVRALGPDGREVDLPYDSLVVAAGASHSYFGKDQFAEFAPGMKTIEDARYLRDGILSKFEMAEIATDPQERAEWLTFVVVGAGPTGVELAGQLAELAHKVLPQDYRSVNTHEARIILLEGARSVLPPFAEKLQRYTQEHLEKMGVEIRLNTLAVDMDHESITVKGPDGVETIRGPHPDLGGRRAGVAAGQDAGREDRRRDRPGRPGPGEPRLHLPGPPGGVRDRRHGVAEQAARRRAARDAGGQVRRQGDQGPAGRRDGRSRSSTSTRAPWPPSATESAVADAFGVKFTGFIGYIMWGFIHVLYLVGWGNRLGTLYTWARAHLVLQQPGHRIITFETANKDVTEGRCPRAGRAPILPCL